MNIHKCLWSYKSTNTPPTPHTLQAIERSRQSTEDSMRGLAASVPAQRGLLGSATAAVGESVRASVDRGCVSAREGDARAGAGLAGVQQACGGMKASTAQSLDSFSLFMDGAGAGLKHELGGHFERLEEFLGRQGRGAGQTLGAAAGFRAQSTEAVVAPTGGTPRKAPFSPLQPLM
jgi:hypothetical protein